MTESYILSFAQDALVITILLAAPILVASLIVGSLISLFQAATQINEVTLTFVPKIIVSGVVLALMGSWMIQKLLAFTAGIFMNLGNMPR